MSQHTKYASLKCGDEELHSYIAYQLHQTEIHEKNNRKQKQIYLHILMSRAVSRTKLYNRKLM